MHQRSVGHAGQVTILTPSGPVQALRGQGLIRATGIPYARAARWQAPQPGDIAGMLARQLSPACPQLPIPRLDAVMPGAFDGLRHDENCLHLSVTAPEGAAGRPVMVWLHGGSYEAGAGDMAVFDPAALVAEQGVVVVAVTHRLGLFGWLGGGGRPANLGALDVIAALRWVARNIAGFGGDPACVTLFGQSSGGDLAARLMLSARTRGLIHRAIIQSAPLTLPLRAGRMRRAMCRAAAGLSAAAPVEAVLARQARIRRAARRFGLRGQMPFGPEFGADPFPAERDLAAAHRAVAGRIPILIGHARDEAALFLPPPARPRLAEPLRRTLVRLLTDRLYARPARAFAADHRAAGGYAAGFVVDWLGGDWGRAHLSELPLLFPGPCWLGTPLVPRGMSLAELTQAGAPLRRIWAEFARQGQVTKGAEGVVSIVSPGGLA